MTEPAPSLSKPEPEPAAASPAVSSAPSAPAPAPDLRPRPLIERIGLAAVALVMAVLFAIVGVAAFVGGEPFLGVMGAIGCLMVVWVGGSTLLRG